jgi:nicotinate-nucleotide pyrophosphorylase (carboxylating)
MQLDAATIYAHTSEFLKEDLGRGDITSQLIINPGLWACGRFIARQDFILCGLEVAEAVFAALDSGIELLSRAYDGQRVTAGAEFAQIEGSACVLLAAERTALNLLCRLSGIATLTREFVERVRGTRAQIVDTRKTTPGLRLFEKYAVSVGGGRNHRMGLDDGILIKDNHIALAGGIRRAVELARRSAPHLMKIEVEVKNQSELDEALAAGADVIMLDNMSIFELSECVRIIRERRPSTLIEASGRITLDNVRQVAECGVDLISVGAITHSAVAVDIAFEITPA